MRDISKDEMTAQNLASCDTHCEADVTLDVRGLVCPMPVLKARKALKGISSGTILKVLATDRAAIRDMPEFCEIAGHVLISMTRTDEEIAFFIQRA